MKLVLPESLQQMELIDATFKEIHQPVKLKIKISILFIGEKGKENEKKGKKRGKGVRLRSENRLFV